MLSQHNNNTMDTATYSSNMESTNSPVTAYHDLSDKWTLWAHLPHNTDWSIKSYIPISTFVTVEDTLAVTETLPPILVTAIAARAAKIRTTISSSTSVNPFLFLTIVLKQSNLKHHKLLLQLLLLLPFLRLKE